MFLQIGIYNRHYKDQETMVNKMPTPPPPLPHPLVFAACTNLSFQAYS